LFVSKETPKKQLITTIKTEIPLPSANLFKYLIERQDEYNTALLNRWR
jgi:hypothetical protein